MSPVPGILLHLVRFAKTREEIGRLIEETAHLFSLKDPQPPPMGLCALIAGIVWCVRTLEEMKAPAAE